MVWPLLDVGSQVKDGKVFSAKGWWGLERVGVGLFTCLVSSSQLPTFVVLAVSKLRLLLEVRVNVLNGKVGSLLLHSMPK